MLYIVKKWVYIMITVRWHGHACFEIVASNGVVIVIDPHDGKSLGLKTPQVLADIVLITHEHFDHNAYAVVAKPGAKVFSMSVGEKIVDNIKIMGIETYHDKDKGKRRGRNVLYKVVVDDISILHLGDLGHTFNGDIASKLKPIDIIMVPVGGVFTIDGKEAWKVIEVLDPNIVIPMHYWIQGLELPLKPVDDFLKQAPKDWIINRIESSSISIDRSTIKPKTVYVLSYSL